MPSLKRSIISICRVTFDSTTLIPFGRQVTHGPQNNSDKDAQCTSTVGAKKTKPPHAQALSFGPSQRRQQTCDAHIALGMIFPRAVGQSTNFTGQAGRAAVTAAHGTARKQTETVMFHVPSGTAAAGISFIGTPAAERGKRKGEHKHKLIGKSGKEAKVATRTKRAVVKMKSGVVKKKPNKGAKGKGKLLQRTTPPSPPVDIPAVSLAKPRPGGEGGKTLTPETVETRAISIGDRGSTDSGASSSDHGYDIFGTRDPKQDPKRQALLLLAKADMDRVNKERAFLNANALFEGSRNAHVQVNERCKRATWAVDATSQAAAGPFLRVRQALAARDQARHHRWHAEVGVRDAEGRAFLAQNKLKEAIEKFDVQIAAKHDVETRLKALGIPAVSARDNQPWTCRSTEEQEGKRSNLCKCETNAGTATAVAVKATPPSTSPSTATVGAGRRKRNRSTFNSQTEEKACSTDEEVCSPRRSSPTPKKVLTKKKAEKVVADGIGVTERTTMGRGTADVVVSVSGNAMVTTKSTAAVAESTRHVLTLALQAAVSGVAFAENCIKRAAIVAGKAALDAEAAKNTDKVLSLARVHFATKCPRSTHIAVKGSPTPHQ